MSDLKPIGSEIVVTLPPDPANPYDDMIETVWRYRVTAHVETVNGVFEAISPIDGPDNPQRFPCRRVWIQQYGIWHYERIPQEELDAEWVTLVKHG